MYLTKNESNPVNVGVFSRSLSGWSPSTQEDIDTYLLEKAKIVKITEDKQAFRDYLKPGVTYNSDLFILYRPKDVTNVNMKGDLLVTAEDRFKYDDINGVPVDFTDGIGLSTFRKTILTEWDRCKRKEIAYRTQINGCTTVAEVDAIVFNFNP